MEDPKFANSQFMKLVSAIGDRSIVAQDGPVVSEGEVGEGASFVSRDAGAGWAGDFMAQPQSPAPNSIQGEILGGPTSQVPIHRSFGHYTSLQRAPSMDYAQMPLSLQASDQISQSNWDQQFLDQEAILQQSNNTQTPLRRKSVHFDPEAKVGRLGNGIPNSLEEAMAHSTSIPGSNFSWENTMNAEEAFDFDEEMFYGFNGPMTGAREPRVGVADQEGWKGLEKDWTEYQQGMGMKTQQDRYLFQAKNPYTSEMALDQASPTLKVGCLDVTVL